MYSEAFSKSSSIFDKFVDVMGLNENPLICIFMNINENDENQDL